LYIHHGLVQQFTHWSADFQRLISVLVTVAAIVTVSKCKLNEVEFTELHKNVY